MHPPVRASTTSNTFAHDMISIYYFQIHLLLNFEKYISKVPARTWGVPDSRSGMEEQSSSDFFTIISPGAVGDELRWPC